MAYAFRCIPGLLVLVLGLAACASSPEVVGNGANADDAPPFLHGAYRPDSWQWEEQPDGASMLAHTSIERCFVAVDWPMHDFGNEGTGRVYERRSVDGTEYRVAERDLGEGMREVHYQRSGEPAQFSVFGSAECHDAAGDVLSRLEKRTGRGD